MKKELTNIKRDGKVIFKFENLNERDAFLYKIGNIILKEQNIDYDDENEGKDIIISVTTIND